MTENPIPSTVHLRQVQSSDLPGVVQLEKRCFKDPYPESLLLQLSEDYGESFVVALFEERIVGYAVVASDFERHHLLSIAVEPIHRRLGIATKMLGFVEARIPPGTIVLELRKSNNEALEFYKKHAFIETGIVDRYYADGEDAITMEKRIS